MSDAWYFCKHCDGVISSIDEVPQHECFVGKDYIYPDEENDRILSFKETHHKHDQFHQDYIEEDKDDALHISKTSTVTPKTATWTKASTQTLLSLYEANQHILDNPRKKTKIWAIISDGLKDFQIVMTPDQVKWKFNRLHAKYKDCVDNNEKSGRASMTFDFYDEFEEIFQKGKKDKNIAKSRTISSTISSTRNETNINEQKSKFGNEEKITNDSGRTKTVKETKNKDVIKRRPIAEAINYHDKKEGGTDKPILDQRTEQPKLSTKENEKNSLNVSKSRNSKRALENEYLEHLKTVQEQQKLRDERLENWMRTKENGLQLKKRQLEMREKVIEMKKNAAAKKLKLNEKRHEDLMQVEMQKCRLLSKFLKMSANAEDSDSN